MTDSDMNRGLLRRAVRWAAVALAMLCAPVTLAQILAPPVRLPTVPGVPTDELNRTVDGALRTTQANAREALRRTRIQALLREHRTVLETDPRGAPIVRSEVVALSPAADALERARAAGFSVGRTRTLDGLEVTIVVLEAPAGMSTRRALARLREADPDGVYDFNHIYTQSGDVAPSQAPPDGAAVAREAGETGAAVKIGLIDGGVARAHPAFRNVSIAAHGCAGGTVPSAHGTAVASLLVGEDGQFLGAASGAQLFAADVYCGLATGGAIDAIADAFAWLSRARTPVINISLVGPPNGLLAEMIRIVTARGHIVVAAVGNDGPGAPPLFPAAYPGVIAVTGVDARERVLLEACRGKHVAFAAPGANMSAAGVPSGYTLVRGTSFAAPIVAGLLARTVDRIDKTRADDALAALIAQAADRGARGRDRIYGYGLVGAEIRPSERFVQADAGR